MIDTDDIEYLFGVFAEDLLLNRFRLETSRPELQDLLKRVDTSEARMIDTMQLDFSLEEFGNALRSIGDGAQFMWSGSTVESAGLRLLLTHIDETLHTKWDREDGPTRVFLADNQVRLGPPRST
jgi:hypothetical protein